MHLIGTMKLKEYGEGFVNVFETTTVNEGRLAVVLKSDTAETVAVISADIHPQGYRLGKGEFFFRNDIEDKPLLTALLASKLFTFVNGGMFLVNGRSRYCVLKVIAEGSYNV